MTNLTPEQVTELSNVIGFMRDLCDMSSEALTTMQAQGNPDLSAEDKAAISASKMIKIVCRPLDLPQPPTSRGDGCFLPDLITDRFTGFVDIEGLGMVFEHMGSICQEILADYPTNDVESA